MDDFTIKLPVSENYESHSGIIIVEKSSNKDLRNKLEDFARYFKKEFKYDFIQYEADTLYDDNKYSGFLFVEIARDKMVEDKPVPCRLCGGGCFRWRDWRDHESCWMLDWIWLHPFLGIEVSSQSNGHTFNKSTGILVFSRRFQLIWKSFCKEAGIN